MAPRKDKNKINDACEFSAAANKRTKLEIMNSTNGVPFSNPFAQFPSFNNFLLQPNHNSTVIGTDLQLSPPTQIKQERLETPVVDDGFVSTVLPQQNFIMNYHVNVMVQNMEQFWRRILIQEVEKRKEIEQKLKEKEEQADRFNQMYHFYAEKSVLLEDTVEQQRRACEGYNVAAIVTPEEEVESCFVDLNSPEKMDVVCRNCRRRPATMLWLPCQHLCVCLVCERRVKNCPICKQKKTESLKINLP